SRAAGSRTGWMRVLSPRASCARWHILRQTGSHFAGKCSKVRATKEIGELEEFMAKIEDRAPAATAPAGPQAPGPNDDIGEETRLRLYRVQFEIRESEQRAYDLFLQNLVKG